MNNLDNEENSKKLIDAVQRKNKENIDLILNY